jgi:hypothetical protein
MTTADLTRHVSVRIALFGSDQVATDSLVEPLTSASVVHDALVGLSDLTRAAAVQELSNAVNGLLDLGVTDISC